VFDAIGTNKQPILYRQYHRNTIYKLEWAQLKSEYFLFSCAEGELVAYKKSTPNDGKMIISIVLSYCFIIIKFFYFRTYVYNKGRMFGIFMEIEYMLNSCVRKWVYMYIYMYIYKIYLSNNFFLNN